MNVILGELGKSPKFCEYIKNIEKKVSPISIWGLNDVGEVQFIQATAEFSKKPICIVTYNEIQAKQIIENLKYFSEKSFYQDFQPCPFIQYIPLSIIYLMLNKMDLCCYIQIKKWQK